MRARSSECEKLWKKQKGKCFYCRCQMTKKNDRVHSITVDHFIPKSRNGGGPPGGNKVGACYRCNNLKADMFPHEFRRLYPDLDQALAATPPNLVRGAALLKNQGLIND